MRKRFRTFSLWTIALALMALTASSCFGPRGSQGNRNTTPNERHTDDNTPD